MIFNWFISIHAPYAGSDFFDRCFLIDHYISIHAPYAGSDEMRSLTITVGCYFNPRSLCRERRNVGICLSALEDFNPRSLCRERPSTNVLIGMDFVFQSTLPMQGATNNLSISNEQLRISIHAPYAGSDSSVTSHLIASTNFNPRSLCRERRQSQIGTETD